LQTANVVYKQSLYAPSWLIFDKTTNKDIINFLSLLIKLFLISILILIIL